MIAILDNTLQIIQDLLENTVSVHLESLGPTSRRHFHQNSVEKTESSSDEELRSEKLFEELRDSTDNTYLVNKVVRHIGSGPAFGMWCDGTVTVRQTIVPDFLTTYSNTLSALTGANSTSEKSKGSIANYLKLCDANFYLSPLLLSPSTPTPTSY